MMKRILLFTALGILLSTAMMAQTVTGRVTDAAGQPLPYANVVLLTMPDSAFVKGAVTDTDGLFTIDSPCNDGLVKVSSVGYRTAWKACTGGRTGDIPLLTDTLTTGEVVVEGRRPSFRLTSEGLLTSVEGTVLSRMGTAEDVLKHVPSVRKTKDGYEVFGKGTPLIYVNGRKVYDLAELDNLKSADIKSVELIRNPGSRYDAGTQAVIKIRTVRQKGEGFGMNLRSYYAQSSNSDLTEQADFNYHHNGLYLFGTYKYSRYAGFNDGTMSQTVHADTLWRQQNVQNYDYSNESHNVVAGFSYDFNANHSVGARYSVAFVPYVAGNVTFSSLMTADGVLYDNITSSSHYRSDYRPDHNLNVYYTGRIGKLGIDFNTDYLSSGETEYTVTDEQSETHDSRNIESSGHVTNRMLASKLVLSHPLWGGTVEAGGEYINTKRTDDYRVNRNDLLPNAFSTLREETIAPFVSYSHDTPLGNLALGVRYEHVRFRYYDAGKYVPGQSRSYSNLFPSVSLSKQAGAFTVQTSYTVKTRRPSYNELTNNVTYANRFTMQSGNPLLKNEIYHNVSLMVMWKMLNLSVDYTDTRDAIIYWAKQLPDNQAITLLNNTNIDSHKMLAANLTASPTFGIWQPRLSLGVMRQWMKLDTGMGRLTLEKPIWTVQFDNTVKLPWGVLLSASLGYQSCGHYQNIKQIREQWPMEVGLTKSFMKDALTVEMKGTDLMNRQGNYNLLYNLQMQLSQSTTYDSRTFTLTLRYNLNTSKSRYKGTGAGNSEKGRL